MNNKAIKAIMTIKAIEAIIASKASKSIKETNTTMSMARNFDIFLRKYSDQDFKCHAKDEEQEQQQSNF